MKKQLTTTTTKQEKNVMVKLKLTAANLAIIAKEKEEVRLKLAVVARELREKAKQLAIVAKQLASTAREKEVTRQKLAIVAGELREKAKQLAIVAKQLALTAREKEEVRLKLAIVAKELRYKASQEKKIQSRLKESEVRYRRLFETAHDGILILNSKTGQITDVNPYLEELLGYSKIEFLDKKLWEVGAFKNMKAAKENFKTLQKQGYVRYEDLPLETKDGRPIAVEFVSNSYVAGDTVVIQCNIRDITDRKRLEQTKETRRLFEDERSKVASIADATHELRTPLAIIKGNVDLALRKVSKNPKSPKTALIAIDYEIKHLSGILSDLTLITSKGPESKNRIVYSEVNLKSLVSRVITRCNALSFKKNISITSKDIPNVRISGDKVYLEKMLVNLIKNSIIYGKQNGHTKITAEESSESITIRVTDDGIGISDEDRPHVFERFYRADKSHTSGGNNSIGLGLAIVKWVAEIHGGEASAENNKNGGSVFSVSLPKKGVKLSPKDTLDSRD